VGKAQEQNAFLMWLYGYVSQKHMRNEGIEKKFRLILVWIHRLFFTSHHIAQGELNRKAIFVLFANSPPQKLSSQGVLFGDILSGAH